MGSARSILFSTRILGRPLSMELKWWLRPESGIWGFVRDKSTSTWIIDIQHIYTIFWNSSVYGYVATSSVWGVSATSLSVQLTLWHLIVSLSWGVPRFGVPNLLPVWHSLLLRIKHSSIECLTGTYHVIHEWHPWSTLVYRLREERLESCIWEIQWRGRDYCTINMCAL